MLVSRPERRRRISRRDLRPAIAEPLEDRTLFAAPTVWNSRGVGGGGAFFAPSFSPFNAGELYVTSDMSGLYKSTDTGASWSIKPFEQMQGNRGSQVQYTSDTNVLYTLDYREDFNNPTQVTPTKSTDGGVTWNQLPAWDTQVGEDAYGLWADPNNTTNLIVNDYGHLYFSGDGGQTFTPKFTAPNPGQGLVIGGAFFDGQGNIYVGTSAGLLVSNNSGSTFGLANVTGIPAGQAIWSFAGARQSNTTRLMAVAINGGDVYNGAPVESFGQAFGGVYTLDVGQSSWTSRTAAIPAGEFPHWVSMARGDISTAYVAGTDSTGSPSILKTTNGGAAWSDVFHTVHNQNIATGWQGDGGDRGWGFGETAMALDVAPNDPNKLAFTDFGYVHLSTDGGATWRQAYVSPADQNPVNTTITPHKPYHGVGLEDTSALWLQWTDPGNIVAGYTDIYGARSTDGGASWAFPTNINLAQNTVYQVSAKSSPSLSQPWLLYAATSGTHDIYQSTYLTDARLDGGSGKIIYSTDQGATWSTLHDFGNPVVYTALDPTAFDRMYASVVDSQAGGIYVTNNLSAGAGSTWTKVGTPPRTEGHPFNIKVLNDGTLVVTYSGRRNSSGTFTASSGVFVSTDRGQTWTDRTLIGASGQPGMQYWTKDLLIDPTDPTQNTWYAAVRSGFGGNGNGMGGLYRTTDRGVHWTRIFTTEGVESATINPATHEMYVSTLDSGLWYGANFDVVTPTFTQTNYPFRQPERVFINPNNPNEVWVTSFGYGMAVGSSGGGDTTPPKVTDATFDYAHKPQKITITFSEDVKTVTSASLTVTPAGGNTVIAFTLTNYDANTHIATFTAGGTGLLQDANYHAVLSKTGITDQAGNALQADKAFDFFALMGDANHDGTVGPGDFNLLATHFGQTNKTWADGDFDFDGTVGPSDFNLLASQFGKTLSASILAAQRLYPAAVPHNRITARRTAGAMK